MLPGRLIEPQNARDAADPHRALGRLRPARSALGLTTTGTAGFLQQLGFSVHESSIILKQINIDLLGVPFGCARAIHSLAEQLDPQLQHLPSESLVRLAEVRLPAKHSRATSTKSLAILISEADAGYFRTVDALDGRPSSRDETVQKLVDLKQRRERLVTRAAASIQRMILKAKVGWKYDVCEHKILFTSVTKSKMLEHPSTESTHIGMCIILRTPGQGPPLRVVGGPSGAPISMKVKNAQGDFEALTTLNYQSYLW